MMVLTAFMISSMRDWIELAKVYGIEILVSWALGFFGFCSARQIEGGVEVTYERGVAEMLGEEGVSGARGVKHGVNWSKIYGDDSRGRDDAILADGTSECHVTSRLSKFI